LGTFCGGTSDFQSAAADFQSAAAEKLYGAAEKLYAAGQKFHAAGQKFYGAADFKSATSILQFYNSSKCDSSAGVSATIAQSLHTDYQ
jgi:hypothetical protein